MTKPLTVGQVKADTEAGLSIEAIMEKYGVSWQTVANRRRDAGIKGRQSKSGSRENQQARFTHRPLANSNKMDIAGHPAAIEGRTLFPSTVRDDWTRILISGVNQSKIGKIITKGRWKGFPVYTLTLEERATCPRSCQHWGDCYGNRMRWSRRHRPGPEFEQRLIKEVHALAQEHSRGFAVRLHVLGDFYSFSYAQLWAALLAEVPALHLFGFTAHWNSVIEWTIRQMNRQWPDQCSIRFSNAPVNQMSTVTLHPGEPVPEPAIPCPQQMGKTLACATCALCWQTERPIAFISH